MEHRILSSYVEDFGKKSQIDGLPEYKQFEYFANYTVMSQVHPEAFSEVADLSDVDVDRDGTFGIDAIAVFVNKNLIKSTDEIDALAKSRNLDVDVLLVQAKTSKSLDSGEVLKFIEGSKGFLNNLDGHSTSENDALKNPARLLCHIFSSKIVKLLSSESPVCRMVFAYAGGHPPSTQLSELALAKCDDLKSIVPDFKSFFFEYWNAEALIESFKQVENQFEVELRIKNNLSLDTIRGVDQAYIGFVEVGEFVKLITAPDGGIRRNVFYDNVRDFQGDDNSVNKEIAEAVSEIESSDKFVLYNNGVTVVVSFMKNMGAHRFLLRNYQIVNGCQTSNVLFSNKNKPGFNEALIPIKIVHTSDADVVSKIIRANNRQTPVPNEAFLTLDKWHKDLQEYVSLESKRVGESLYYERRSREFSLLDDAPDKKRVIGLHGMVRAYAAVFMQKPHMVIANNPSSILREKGSIVVFGSDHKFSPYLASAMLVYKINEHANGKRHGPEVVRFRFHVAMLIACVVSGGKNLPMPNAKAVDKLCDDIISVCLSATKFSQAVNTAFKLAEEAEKEFLLRRDFSKGNSPARSAQFTDFLIGKLYT
ncbi:AIPR family protein [uncultured Xanthomonas sp.]|uniref:AIPR family protein n=1 Tax=uncultured Xanthomonas sp. TaxID=152831 RepID=UPI0025FE755E|nr:AIPR family protein [uncultured Xanthomonas sp.]